MRVFFALWPGELARTTLGHATRKAVRSSGGYPVPEQNLHVTLAFLGSVALSRLAELGAIAAHIASSNVAAPFDLVFDRIEYWEKPRALWSRRPAHQQGARRWRRLPERLRRRRSALASIRTKSRSTLTSLSHARLGS